MLLEPPRQWHSLWFGKRSTAQQRAERYASIAPGRRGFWRQVKQSSDTDNYENEKNYQTTN
jgi:hypothetical protein